MTKIALITSRGGHLFQLYQLKPWWQKFPHFWVTATGQDVDSLLKNEKVYYGHFPEQRHLINAVKNLILAIKILFKEKPQVLVSCGAGIAPPFFLIGKIFGLKLIYLEPIDFIAYPTLTGRLLYRLVDLFLIQDPKQKKFFPESHFWGSTL